MVFNATVNNISAISWRSVFLVEETRLPEKTNDPPQVSDTLSHIMLYRAGFELKTLVVICTEFIDSYKSNYHANTPRLPLCS